MTLKPPAPIGDDPMTDASEPPSMAEPQIVKATPLPPEKPKSTRERVNKAVMDLVLADGLDENVDNELTRWNHTTANVTSPGNGGELAPMPEPAHPARRDYLKAKVEQPAGVLRRQSSADALGLLADADAITLGLELADDLKCKSRAEKMLAHQAASFHVASMQFLARANVERGRASSAATYNGINQAASVESARMLNAAARASGACADAIAAIKKLKTGGKQIVQVQHVVVKDGGQAVVGQNVKASRPNRRSVPAAKSQRLALPRPKNRKG